MSTGRVVVFGATGYTGCLVVDELVRRGTRPVVAGRTESKLAALADRHDDLEIAVADAGDPATVRNLVDRGDVLVSTVGPFVLHGRPALDAALASGAHYVDSTGEAPFVRTVQAEHERATAAGQVLMTAAGFDFVPGLLAGARALEAGGEQAVGLDVVYRGLGDAEASSGTQASGALLFEGPTHVRRDGAVVERPAGSGSIEIDDGGERVQALTFGGTEPYALASFHPALRHCAVHLDLGSQTRAITLGSRVFRPLLRAPVVGARLRAALRRRAEVTGEGPDEAARANSSGVAIAIARDVRGNEVARARVTTPNPYDLTASSMAWSAIGLVEGRHAGVGAISPLEAFGLDALDTALAHAGCTTSIVRP